MDLYPTFELPDIPIQELNDPLLSGSGVSVSILRADLVHPIISGNKWFKLKYNLIKAKHQGRSTVLSFGGPWSNHLHALAEAGRQFNLNTIGIVRGEIPIPLNSCLQDAVTAGMQLECLDRASYRRKDEADVIEALHKRFGDFYLIPEGGANREGVLGCAEIVSCFTQPDFDILCMACGTGTMLTGVVSKSALSVLGFQVLKGEGYLKSQIDSNLALYQLATSCHWSINDNFHFGGYAKVSSELLAFISRFETVNNIPLEPVYSGKMLFGIYALIKKRDYFPQNSRILIIHGGGLQGNRGFV